MQPRGRALGAREHGGGSGGCQSRVGRGHTCWGRGAGQGANTGWLGREVHRIAALPATPPLLPRKPGHRTEAWLGATHEQSRPLTHRAVGHCNEGGGASLCEAVALGHAAAHGDLEEVLHVARQRGATWHAAKGEAGRQLGRRRRRQQASKPGAAEARFAARTAQHSDAGCAGQQSAASLQQVLPLLSSTCPRLRSSPAGPAGCQSPLT